MLNNNKMDERLILVLSKCETDKLIENERKKRSAEKFLVSIQNHILCLINSQRFVEKYCLIQKKNPRVSMAL